MKASGWLLILALFAVLGIGGFAWYRFEGDPPGSRRRAERYRPRGRVELRASDAGRARCASGHVIRQRVAARREYQAPVSGGARRADRDVQPRSAGLGTSPAPARSDRGARSWRGGLGNETRRAWAARRPEPPRIEVTTGSSDHLARRADRDPSSIDLRAHRAMACESARRVPRLPAQGGRANERVALFAFPPTSRQRPRRVRGGRARVTAARRAGRGRRRTCSPRARYSSPHRSSSRWCRASRRAVPAATPRSRK